MFFMKGSEDVDEMTSSEISRLIDWLKSKGMSDTEIVECLKYIGR